MSHRTRKRGLAVEKNRVANRNKTETTVNRVNGKGATTRRDEVDRLIKKYSNRT